MHLELEMWGRAQCEATRHCASEWEHNLGEGQVKIPLVAMSHRSLKIAQFLPPPLRNLRVWECSPDHFQVHIDF